MLINYILRLSFQTLTTHSTFKQEKNTKLENIILLSVCLSVYSQNQWVLLYSVAHLCGNQVKSLEDQKVNLKVYYYALVNLYKEDVTH